MRAHPVTSDSYEGAVVLMREVALDDPARLHLGQSAAVFSAHVDDQPDVVGFGRQRRNIAREGHGSLDDRVVEDVAKGRQHPYPEDLPADVARNDEGSIEEILDDEGPDGAVLIHGIAHGNRVHGQVQRECMESGEPGPEEWGRHEGGKGHQESAVDQRHDGVLCPKLDSGFAWLRLDHSGRDQEIWGCGNMTGIPQGAEDECHRRRNKQKQRARREGSGFRCAIVFCCFGSSHFSAITSTYSFINVCE